MITMDPLEKIFGKTAQMTVLKNLIERQNESTYLSGIAEETGEATRLIIDFYNKINQMLD
jgi:NTP pyrophosphatase (non-canonical NTP hydrolase)